MIEFNARWFYSVPLFLLSFLSGCQLLFDGGVKKPPRPDYMTWSKPGIGELGVKQALLECGALSIFGTSIRDYEQALGISEQEEIANYSVLVDFCMEHAGFASTSGYSKVIVCSWEHNAHLPACQPGAEIPTRSVERRLNSWHCTRNPNTVSELCR